MSVAKTWVFPILRLVIFAAIAAALVKLAFFADTTDTRSPEFPTGSIAEPQVPVTVDTVRNDVTLSATIAADEAIPVRATLAGEVRKVIAAAGQWVDAGAPLFTIRSETPGLPRDDGTVGPAKVSTQTVTAPASGVLSHFPLIAGQLVSVGEEAARVAPPTFHVTGQLAPEQQYRLLNRPTEATVSIPGGPAPFACPALTITTAVSGQADAAASGTTVRCAVPAEVTVFAGLTAQLTMAGGVAENVLVVPTTAVEGGAQSGIVHVVLPDGGTEERPVSLGLNDGTLVQIVDGLVEGELVLQFVPGAPAVVGGQDCREIGPGTVECFDVAL